MQLQWTPYLSVGVVVIDHQHQELFARFNHLIDAMLTGEGTQELNATLKFLQKYVVTHFEAEERLMEKYAFRGVATHKAEHNQFVEDVRSFEGELRANGPKAAIAVTMLNRLAEWLVNHVGGSDKDIGSFLKVAMVGRKAA